MRFVTWLFDQVDNGGVTAKFAKISWDDVNNGCAHATFSVGQWIEHFSVKHPDKYDLLIEMLLRAFAEYKKELSEL